MITLDSSALFAVVNRRDRDHDRVAAALKRERRPYLLPVPILAEIAYLIEGTLAAAVLHRFLVDIERGGYTLDCGEQDIPRIRDLVQRYADPPLGLADAAVIACAERNGGRVLTLDLRHFGVVAREGTIEIAP